MGNAALQRDLRQFQAKREAVALQVDDVDRQIRVARARGEVAVASVLQPDLNRLLDQLRGVDDDIEAIRTAINSCTSP